MAASRKTIREWVAGKLGRIKRVIITVDGADNTLYDVPRIMDYARDNDTFVDSTLMLDTDDLPMAEWRRVSAASITLGQLNISRAYDVEPDPGQAALLYSLLNPDEWNEAINEALTTLYFSFRHEITLTVDGDGNATKEYELPSWISQKALVLGVRWRNIDSGFEDELGRYRLDESLGTVTLHLIDTPRAYTTYSLMVEAKRWQTRLDEDDWGTSLPQQLWQAAVEVAALHKITKKYGAHFKAQFMQDTMIAERELVQMRAANLPTIIAREYVNDDEWSGPDIDEFFISSGWA